ncbi:glycerol-3-phosphate responsive antiterminator [[Clostridium] aminophilum]|uniref:Glycerol-3-phosphate responsive antiterminator (mRNA-binding) n=1 Tax=[Clostridium] aminophilum TaxID=1526 RepID=A0A1I6IYU6_9FIRM|nr:glycerol-3-phosphate responsive antiterminator [[Clostridium] aminophilum]MCR4629836.1 glycerol-3-phosphate responsive antiterminator [Clostridium sp.]SFR71887.1 Glycerol-3-phosphate responsive antiterminator (mRNA-binding) [[Clostridium] aminophilum]
MNMIDLLETSPVIAAVKNESGLENCLKTDCRVVFLLFGTICDVAELVDRVKESGKIAIVHVDLIQGLSSKEVAVDFIRRNTRADGIISTKSPIVKHAKELGMICIQRTFVVDSMALSTLKKQIESFHPDAIEIMPGVMPRVIQKIRQETELPLIAGGLLSDKKDIMAAFEAGADAVSTTREELWYV